MIFLKRMRKAIVRMRKTIVRMRKDIVRMRKAIVKSDNVIRTVGTHASSSSQVFSPPVSFSFPPQSVSVFLFLCLSLSLSLSVSVSLFNSSPHLFVSPSPPSLFNSSPPPPFCPFLHPLLHCNCLNELRDTVLK